VGEDCFADAEEAVVRPTTPATRRGRVLSAVLAVGSVFGYGYFAAWQQRTYDRTPGRNTFDKGMRPVTYGDTPCEVGRLRVDWRAVSTRRCEGDRWVLLNWPETEKAVLGGRDLPPGEWRKGIGELNPFEGEQLDSFAAAYGWSNGESWLRIAMKPAAESEAAIASRSESRKADRRWRPSQGYAVDADGTVTIDLPSVLIRASGSDGVAVAEYMAKQYGQ
jgi:hypothetical protein